MKLLLHFQWILLLTLFALCFLETYGKGGFGGRGGGGSSRGSSSRGSSSRSRGSSSRSSSASSSVPSSSGYYYSGSSHATSYSNSYGSDGSSSNYNFGTGSYPISRNIIPYHWIIMPELTNITVGPEFARIILEKAQSLKSRANLERQQNILNASDRPMKLEPANILENVEKPSITADVERSYNIFKNIEELSSRAELERAYNISDQFLTLSPGRSSQPKDFQGISPALIDSHSHLPTPSSVHLGPLNKLRSNLSETVRPNQPIWPIVSNVQPSAEPALCKETCLNGGSCASPGVCKCPTDYRGPRCEYSYMKCDILKLVREVETEWICTHTQTETKCKIKCKGSEEFESSTAEEYKCTPDGTWTLDTNACSTVH